MEEIRRSGYPRAMRGSNPILLFAATLLLIPASACGARAALDVAETSTSTTGAGTGAGSTSAGTTGAGETGTGSTTGCRPTGSACSTDGDCCQAFCTSGACSLPCQATCEASFAGGGVCSGSLLGSVHAYAQLVMCAEASCPEACSAYTQHGPMDEACSQCLIIPCGKLMNQCQNE